jgi:hypothetical protein
MKLWCAAPANAALQKDAADSQVVSGRQGDYEITAPSAWTSQQKAGADVLIIDPDAKSTNVGVTVVPVRVQTLAQFGSLSDVSEKLLAAEEKKVRRMVDFK